MKTCLFCFSDSGAKLALSLCEKMNLQPEQVHSVPKFAAAYGFTAHESVCREMGSLFSEHEALIFIGACGIAVRDIAPHLKSKITDPAVLVVDDRGKFVIPILSGHIGGANALARRIAELIGATAVITTATDGAGKFSCDAWAAAHGCAVSSMGLAKKISAEILVRDLPISSEFDLPEALPAGLFPAGGGDLGVYVGIRTETPYRETLRLIPRIVTLGIGCRRGAPEEGIRQTVTEVLKRNGIDPRAVCRIASVDLKRNEAGLLAFAASLGADTAFFSADELNAVPGRFEESEFVRKTVGTGNVCERAAVLAGGKRILKKVAENGVTVAAAIADWGVTF